MFLSVMSLQVPAAPVNSASLPDWRNIHISRLHHRYGLKSHRCIDLRFAAATSAIAVEILAAVV